MKANTRKERVDQFLADINATPLWEGEGPNNSTMTFFNVRGNLLIVQAFKDGGVDVYAPVSRDNTMDGLFQSISDYTGVTL